MECFEHIFLFGLFKVQKYFLRFEQEILLFVGSVWKTFSGSNSRTITTIVQAEIHFSEKQQMNRKFPLKINESKYDLQPKTKSRLFSQFFLRIARTAVCLGKMVYLKVLCWSDGSLLSKRQTSSNFHWSDDKWANIFMWISFSVQWNATWIEAALNCDALLFWSSFFLFVPVNVIRNQCTHETIFEMASHTNHHSRNDAERETDWILKYSDMTRKKVIFTHHSGHVEQEKSAEKIHNKFWERKNDGKRNFQDCFGDDGLVSSLNRRKNKKKWFALSPKMYGLDLWLPLLAAPAADTIQWNSCNREAMMIANVANSVYGESYADCRATVWSRLVLLRILE